MTPDDAPPPGPARDFKLHDVLRPSTDDEFSRPVVTSTITKYASGEYHCVVKGACEHFDWSKVCDTEDEAHAFVKKYELKAADSCEMWGCYRHRWPEVIGLGFPPREVTRG